MTRSRIVLGAASALVLIPGLLAAHAGSAAADPSARVRPKCTITGTNGPDMLKGTSGRDVICGLGGDDILLGRGGDDAMYGGPGDDRVLGGPGDDELHGGTGEDILGGEEGDDTLQGGPGDDRTRQDATLSSQSNGGVTFISRMPWPGTAGDGYVGKYVHRSDDEGACTHNEQDIHWDYHQRAPQPGDPNPPSYVSARVENPGIFKVDTGSLFGSCEFERASAHYILYSPGGHDIGDIWFVAESTGSSQMLMRSYSHLSNVTYRSEDTFIELNFTFDKT